MGPIRSLYEEGGELESLGAQQTSEGDPIILRPVQISDCGGYSSLPIHFIVTEFSGVTACPLRFLLLYHFFFVWRQSLFSYPRCTCRRYGVWYTYG